MVSFILGTTHWCRNLVTSATYFIDVFTNALRLPVLLSGSVSPILQNLAYPEQCFACAMLLTKSTLSTER